MQKGKGLRSAITGHDPPADVRQVSERHFAMRACASGNHTSTLAGPELWEEQPTGAPSGVGITHTHTYIHTYVRTYVHT